MKFLLSLTIALALPTLAAARPVLTIEAPAARVIVIPEARQDMALEADARLAIHPVAGGSARVTGASSWFEQNIPWLFGYSCQATGVSRWGQTIALKDLPMLTVRVPLDAEIVSKGAIYGQTGAGRALKLSASGCGTWRLGSLSSSLSATQAGPGQVIASHVDGRLTATVEDAGRVVVGQGVVTSATLVMNGSGRIDDRGTAGVLNAKMNGSGRINVRLLAGQANVSYDGDGDVTWGRPKGKKFCSGLSCY
ncbi:GIN domain-containing protein [Phenylobacterium sp.]|uniref:GIN domain-containing protein n=1 Tax=Phenylobacterium sp. TaxID=1871053 RepID=UPI00271E5341|nr:DUF2807 domain-containing protein [Phenylobacterium sp.]MDO8801151.1 DUF2807 domain-containing protein [Phenylobacterium sp.]